MWHSKVCAVNKLLVKLKQYFPFTIDDSIINYKAFSDWFDMRMDAVCRSPCWFTGTWDSLGRWCWQQQAPTRLECLGWRAAEPTLCWLNGFPIKVLLKERDTEATVPKSLVAFLPVCLACGLFSHALVLPCGRWFAAAAWQLQLSLAFPFSQVFPQAQGGSRAGLGLKPVSKSCRITGKAL